MIEVSTKTAYLSGQSHPEAEQYVFSYTITITNHSDNMVKLLSRYWQITDANGDTTIVEGEGVIGQQPSIPPAESFTYTSGSMLKTPLGTMEGRYYMKDHNGDEIKVKIPVFRLAIPNILN